MKAQEWSGQNPEYRKLHTKYQGELRDILKKRFDRFAVLHRWNFADPAQCEFHVESLESKAPDSRGHRGGADERSVRAGGFRRTRARSCRTTTSRSASCCDELQEPRPAGQDCIPWLGETAMKERILRLCARGKIAINLRGMEYLQAQPGEDEETAWRRLRPKLSLHRPPAGRGVPAAAFRGARDGWHHAPHAEPAPPTWRTFRRRHGPPPTPPGGAPVSGGEPVAPAPTQIPAGGIFGGGTGGKPRTSAVQPGHLAAQPDRQARGLGHRPGHAGGRSYDQGDRRHRRPAQGTAQEAARRHDLRAALEKEDS